MHGVRTPQRPRRIGCRKRGRFPLSRPLTFGVLSRRAELACPFAPCQRLSKCEISNDMRPWCVQAQEGNHYARLEEIGPPDRRCSGDALRCDIISHPYRLLHVGRRGLSCLEISFRVCPSFVCISDTRRLAASPHSHSPPRGKAC